MKNKLIILMSCVATILCIFGVAACTAGEDEESSHTHAYSTQWSYDEEYHWHKATCEHTGETSERSKHTYVDDTCSVCGYTKDEVTYVVTFDANNGRFSDATVKEIEVEKGAHLSQVEEPIRGGYLFDGWARDAAGNQKWDFEADTVDRNITLYAVWQEIPVTIVKINYYDGDTLLKSEDFATGSLYEASYNPQMIGYKVVHWKDAEGNIFEKGIITQELNLYAEKVAKTYNIKLDVNEGNELTALTITVDYNEIVSFAVPTREGHEFLGWYYRDTRITDKKGNGIKPWNIDEDCTLTAKWEANSYIVALNNMSPTSGIVSGNGMYAYGSNVIVTAEENKGYNFVGWFNEKDELVSENKIYSFTIKQDVTLTAKWSSFTVTAKSNDEKAGTVSNYNKTVVGVGEEVKLIATTKNGYTFTGWYNGDELLTTDTQYSFKMPKQDVVYTAKWIKVILESENTSAGTVNTLNGTYVVGDSATATATTKAGYTFIGWFNGSAKVCDTVSYTFAMSSTTTFTAKWIKVILESENTSAGTVNTLSGTYVVGDSVTATATTKAGYTFIGWYNKDVKVCDTLSYTFAMPAEATTFTAKWIKVTLDKNIPDAGSVSDLTGKYIANKRVSVTATTNDGYTWLGWYIGDEKITENERLEFNMPAVEITYTARWKGNEYTVTFDANGGVLNNSPIENVIFGRKGIFNIPYRNDYYFGGWFTAENIKITDETGEMLSTWGIADDITLIAKWLRCISFNTNGGNELQAIYVEPGERVTIPTTTKTGYTLNAWLLNGIAWSRPYTMPDANITLEAEWRANTYYIYYNNTSLQVTYGRWYSIPTPTKSGYTFRYFTLSNGTQFAQSGIYNTAGSTTLTCKWRAELTRTVSSGCTIKESSQNLEKGMTFTITYDGAVMKNFHIETNTAVNVTFTGPGWTYSNTKSCGINSGTITGGGDSKMVITITIIDPSDVSTFNLTFTVDKNLHSGEGL